MSKRFSKFLRILRTLLLIALWIVIGWCLKSLFIKVKVVTVEQIKLVDYNDPLVFQDAVKQTSEKYNIKEEVFYAIKECEGGHLWAWSNTSDGGYFQINWKTAKSYGAKDLEDVINPYKATELAAKIIQKDGLKAWATYDCIVKKIISKGG